MPPRRSPFEQAQTRLDAIRRLTLDTLLTEWSASPDIPPLAAANLRTEHGSGISELGHYLHELADKAPHLTTSGPGPRNGFEEAGKRFSLSGHEAKPYRGGIFGRAMLLEKFARYLAPHLDAIGCYDTEDVIRTSLQELDGASETTAPSRLRDYFPAIRSTPVGKGAVFATFLKPFSDSKNPWKRPIPSSDAIRRGTALGEDPPGRDYVLFAYRLPAGVTPLVPTTASPGWAYQRWFRPSSTAHIDLHGWTVPIGSGVAKRPEIVHSEIDGSTLIFPLYIAKP